MIRWKQTSVPGPASQCIYGFSGLPCTYNQLFIKASRPGQSICTLYSDCCIARLCLSGMDGIIKRFNKNYIHTIYINVLLVLIANTFCGLWANLACNIIFMYTWTFSRTYHKHKASLRYEYVCKYYVIQIITNKKCRHNEADRIWNKKVEKIKCHWQSPLTFLLINGGYPKTNERTYQAGWAQYYESRLAIEDMKNYKLILFYWYVWPNSKITLDANTKKILL